MPSRSRMNPILRPTPRILTHHRSEHPVRGKKMSTVLPSQLPNHPDLRVQITTPFRTHRVIDDHDPFPVGTVKHALDDALDRHEERLDKDQFRTPRSERSEQPGVTRRELLDRNHPPARVQRVPPHVIGPDKNRHHVRLSVEHVLPPSLEVHHLVAGMPGVQPGHRTPGIPEAPLTSDQQRIAAPILPRWPPKVGDRVAGEHHGASGLQLDRHVPSVAPATGTERTRRWPRPGSMIGEQSERQQG